jgi:xylulokinase
MINQKKVFLCIDAGTTRFKAALVSGSGRVLSKSEHYYTSDSKGLHEYRARDFHRALANSIKELSITAVMGTISGVGITGHGPTLIPVDCDGNPLHSAVGYLDNRVKKYIELMAQKKTNRITSTMYIPIALFFRHEMADIYTRTHRFLQIFDYLAYILTGVFSASSSSVGIKPWDKTQIERAGLDTDKFPEIRYMGEIIGTVSEKASPRFSIPPGVPVFAIGVDFAAALVGTGMIEKGKSCERSGSSGGINLCWDSPVADPRLLSYTHFIGGMWNIAGITTTSGKAVDWLSSIVDTKHFSPPGRKRSGSELLFFPYLKGERTPLWNPYAKGMFFGLTSEHTKSDIIFSVYLGVVLSLMDCIQIIIENHCSFDYPVVTTGWGAKIDWFTQLKADVTGLPFVKIQTSDAELLGIALICAVSSGLYENIHEAVPNTVRVDQTFEPEESIHRHYEEVFRLYKELQQKIKDSF